MMKTFGQKENLVIRIWWLSIYLPVCSVFLCIQMLPLTTQQSDFSLSTKIRNDPFELFMPLLLFACVYFEFIFCVNGKAHRSTEHKVAGMNYNHYQISRISIPNNSLIQHPLFLSVRICCYHFPLSLLRQMRGDI